MKLHTKDVINPVVFGFVVIIIKCRIKIIIRVLTGGGKKNPKPKKKTAKHFHQGVQSSPNQLNNSDEM